MKQLLCLLSFIAKGSAHQFQSPSLTQSLNSITSSPASLMVAKVSCSVLSSGRLLPYWGVYRREGEGEGEGERERGEREEGREKRERL